MRHASSPFSDLRHAYQAAIKHAGRTESPSQLSIIERLQPLLQTEKKGASQNWFNWSQPVVQEKHGAFIFGDVGTGKTMIMDLFYDLFPAIERDEKLRQHFHQFMLRTHSSTQYLLSPRAH
jgi:predicted ATPase